MRIRSNITAANADRMIKINTGATAKNMEKLSSGYQINDAADDAAGLAISEKMRKQIRGLTRAVINCEDGISLVQTAEGALNELHDMLQRMNELSIQAANGVNSESDRSYLDKEFAQLLDEINRVSKTTTFNGMRIFADGIEEEKTLEAESVEEEAEVKSVVDRSVGVVCGDFTVYGGVEGVDFSYDSDSNVLTVLSGTELVIEGTGEATTETIAVATGVDATLTLSNVNIDVSNVSNTSSVCALSVGSGSLTLTLEGENTLASGRYCSGLQLNNGASLVITADSTGSLTASGGNCGAGIGSGYYGSCGDITINGGTIIAESLSDGAGIGSGNRGSCGTIKITGGTVTATGGGYAAGIGSGDYGSCGDIIISGGTITATSICFGAGIGSGTGSCGNIIISGGTITATGGYGGAGIGSSIGESSCGNIIISGGIVTATGDVQGAGIGSGSDGSCGNITISGGSITATGGFHGAGIGSGQSGSCGDITISGAEYTATGGTNAEDIGKGSNGTVGTVTVGASVTWYDTSSTSSTSSTNAASKSYIQQYGENRWWIQTGVEGKVGMEIIIGAIDTKALGLNGANVRTEEDCDSAIDLIAAAIKKISGERTRLGSYQNRLEHTVNNLENVVENTTAAESQIRDTDMAEEMVAYTVHQILLQAGQAVLAQANQSNQGVLALLG